MVERSKLLLVDDLPANLLSLEALIEQPEYELFTARSGVEALKLMLDNDFDVVLLDVNMPGMDGFEIAKLMKRRPRSRHTPIIFLTAASRDEERFARAFEVGAIDILYKPLNGLELRAKVARLVELQRETQRLRREAELNRDDGRMPDSQLVALNAVRTARYRNLAEAIPPMVWTSHPDGSIDYCNQRWFDYTGLDFERAKGWGWLAVLHPDDRQAYGQSWQDAIGEGRQIESEVRIRDATSGEYRWHLSRALPEHDDHGNIIAWIGTFTDIQELKVAQAQAERANRRLEFLAQAGDALSSSLDYAATLQQVARQAVPRLADWCVVDLVDGSGGVSQMAAAHVDPSQEHLARALAARQQLEPGQAHGLARVLETGQPEIYPEIDADWASAALGAEHPEILRELGARSYLVVPLIARGRILGAITMVYSREGRRFDQADLELGMQLATRAALATDNARLFTDARLAIEQRDEFLAVASHDLRTPLSGMLIRLEAIRRRAARGNLDAAELNALVDRAEQQGKRVHALLEELLDLSRLEARRLELRREQVDLASIVRQVASGLAPIIEQSGSTVDLQLEEVTGDWDPFRLDQILANLLSNALKFGEGRPVTVRLDRDGDQAVVTVADQGKGIPAEHMVRLFGRFERGAEARNIEGTGLGLHIAKRLVEAHGGTITVESAVGVGTTFEVRLPRSAPKGREAVRAQHH